MRATLWAVVAGLGLAACQAPSDTGGPGGAASGPARAGGASGAAEGRSSPAPAPARPEPVVVPEGTTLAVTLDTALSSATSRSGDLIAGRLARDVSAGGRVVLPAGTELRGRVTTAVRSGKVKGRARLAFDFDRVVAGGKEHPLEARAVDITAPKGGKRDAAMIGGGAGAGALIGALVGGKKGAAVGAAVGVGAGTGVVLTTRGKEVVVPAGSRVSVKLLRELTLG